MTYESSDVETARNFARQAAGMLERVPAFQRLDPATRSAITRDLGTIRHALEPEERDPYALTLETPYDLRRRRGPFQENAGAQRLATGEQNQPQPARTSGPTSAATQTIALRAGALSDELDFPSFVASLIHGTFDAIVDATIRQMEAFADLVSAVAQDVDRFTSQNVTPNQVRDWLAEQYPRDVVLELPARPGQGEPRLRRRAPPDQESSPSWLADYGLESEDLTDELIEEQIVPAARRAYGEKRLQMLAAMVLMGMNRVIVRDGSITAKIRIRAAARDRAGVQYAAAEDPGSMTWGGRGG